MLLLWQVVVGYGAFMSLEIFIPNAVALGFGVVLYFIMRASKFKYERRRRASEEEKHAEEVRAARGARRCCWCLGVRVISAVAVVTLTSRLCESQIPATLL